MQAAFDQLAAREPEAEQVLSPTVATAYSGDFVHPVRSFRTPPRLRAGSGRRQGLVDP